MAQLSGTPVLILKEGTSRTRGKSAQSNNIMAGIVISDAVKSTLGPRGMDKMLVDSLGDVTITNDGASILKEIDGGAVGDAIHAGWVKIYVGTTAVYVPYFTAN